MFRPVPKPQPREKKKPKPPKARNVVRHTDEWTRAYGSPERVEWIKAQACVVTGCRAYTLPMWESENAHIEGDGMGRKADADKIVPMCKAHHRELHRVGREEFEGTYYLDLAALALNTERIWRRITNTSTRSPSLSQESSI